MDKNNNLWIVNVENLKYYNEINFSNDLINNNIKTIKK